MGVRNVQAVHRQRCALAKAGVCRISDAQTAVSLLKLPEFESVRLFFSDRVKDLKSNGDAISRSHHAHHLDASPTSPHSYVI